MIRSLSLATQSLAALLLAAFLLALPGLAFAETPSFPALTGRVVDEAGVLQPAAKARLTAELEAHEQRTGQQIVVAVVASLGGQPIEDYGVALGRAWGIGQKGGNTGAILLVSPADRRVRIEVGYGLEGELTDAASTQIISQTIVPRFKQGDMSGGIVAGTEQILRTLGDTLTAAPPPVRVQHRQDEGHGSIGSIVLTFLIFGLFFWLARRRGGVGGSAFLPFLIASSFGGRGGSFGGGGGDSGGGFSGGGGSFGGGGASGSW